VAYLKSLKRLRRKNNCAKRVFAKQGFQCSALCGFDQPQGPIVTNPNQLLRIEEVSNFTSLGKSTINLWVAKGKFPKPIFLSPIIKVWRTQQLIDWINERSNSSTAAMSITEEIVQKAKSIKQAKNDFTPSTPNVTFGAMNGID
jgi:predicted DNA-binding transcriptional regulator AlpA